MPEGHAIHRLAAQLQDAFGGHKIESTSPQGRFNAQAVDGLEFGDARAWGKHLFIGFTPSAEIVHIHLGLYGRWTFTSEPDSPVVGQVRWRIVSDGTTADLRGPATCELLLPHEYDAVLSRLGPDPLRPDADAERAADRVLRSRAPIATLLMDQAVVSGPGNIFRAEVLFRQKIDPLTPGRDLSRAAWQRVWDDLVFLMAQGFDRGRIDTVRPEHEPEAMGRPPREDEHGGEVYVYRREGLPCLVCGSPVAASVLNGRNLFWCPHCQRA